MSEPARSGAIRDVLLETGGMSIDKLPMLRVILERTATLYAERLWEYAALDGSFGFETAESGRIGEILQAYEGNAIAGLFSVPKWDTQVVVGFDRTFVFSVVEMMFGGDGAEQPVSDPRGFSAIEIRIARMLIEQAGRALHTAFAPVSGASFRFERAETRMDFASAGRRSERGVVAKFALAALGRGGGMFVVIPQMALAPLRQALARNATSEPASGDPDWARQIHGEVSKTAVPLRVVLDERTLTLDDAARFKVGQVIELQATPSGRVKLEGNEQPLFWGELGQSDGVYHLRIEEAFDPEQEFISDILGR